MEKVLPWVLGGLGLAGAATAGVLLLSGPPAAPARVPVLPPASAVVKQQPAAPAPAPVPSGAPDWLQTLGGIAAVGSTVVGGLAQTGAFGADGWL